MLKLSIEHCGIESKSSREFKELERKCLTFIEIDLTFPEAFTRRLKWFFPLRVHIRQDDTSLLSFWKSRWWGSFRYPSVALGTGCGDTVWISSLCPYVAAPGLGSSWTYPTPFQQALNSSLTISKGERLPFPGDTRGCGSWGPATPRETHSLDFLLFWNL